MSGPPSQETSPSSKSAERNDVPRGNRQALWQHFRSDCLSGFLVFLIALPLCLGIALASGFPPIAGIFTAVIGAILTPWVSNSELTIKGPAAGMIVIVLGCVEDFGGNGMLGSWESADQVAYRAALAISVVAAGLQILFGLVRGGVLGDFFPVTAVHGMLAAIGVIIIIKQFPVALGVSAGGEPLEMLLEFPAYVSEANPAIAGIGIASLLIVFGWPLLANRLAALKVIPAPVAVLIVAIPMGMAWELTEPDVYRWGGESYELGPQFLVSLPDRPLGMFDEITTPTFHVLGDLKAWKWVLMFFVIGSLESILSAKAVDLLDPWRRKSSMNRDITAVGGANLVSGMLGGLPMISEIVRSKANIDNGARTRFANMWHGIFVLLCVALIPMLLHRIPLAALAALLIFTGFRLAHPTEFMHAYRIGKEQLAIFATTLIAVLATDLLIGIGIGIVLKLIIHYRNGVTLRSMFHPNLTIAKQDDQAVCLIARQSVVFSNWIRFRHIVDHLGMDQQRSVTIDFSAATLVDHSVMEKLDELKHDYAQAGLALELQGLDLLEPFTSDAHSARMRASDQQSD